MSDSSNGWRAYFEAETRRMQEKLEARVDRKTQGNMVHIRAELEKLIEAIGKLFAKERGKQRAEIAALKAEIEALKAERPRRVA